MARGQPHFIGVRLTTAEYEGLQRLMTAVGQNRSQVIRYLVQTAAAHPEAVAAGIRRSQAKRDERT